jgi:phosphoribosylformylglycinamidine synthase
MIKIAIIQYPGSNCEYETARAVSSCGMESEIFRWNRDPDELQEFDGYIISGGFSYQDRVRASAIAAKKRIIKTIIKEAEKGKPVLGICNGAQILIEAGMIPGIRWGEIQMALAPNVMEGRSGYYCDWVWVRVEESGSVFTSRFKKAEVFPIPIAHAEGRFVTRSEGLLDELISNKQAVFRYCTREGEVREDFLVNPNGSIFNLAGVSNKEGNILAMMPHPERANFLRQVPDDLGNDYSRLKLEALRDAEKLNQPGPGRRIFLSMKEYIE